MHQCSPPAPELKLNEVVLTQTWDLVSIDLEALESVIGRSPLTEVEATDFILMDKILGQNFPDLEQLHVVTSGVFPSVEVPTTTDVLPSFFYPRLTNFRFRVDGSNATPDLGGKLLNFLRNCPELEDALFLLGSTIKVIKSASSNRASGPISLPRLRSLTHEYVGPRPHWPHELSKHLSFPATCTVSYNKVICMKCGSTEERLISLDGPADRDTCPHPTEVVEYHPDRTLHFKHCLSGPEADGCLEQVNNIAVPRKGDEASP
jgi:hypothetical protein